MTRVTAGDAPSVLSPYAGGRAHICAHMGANRRPPSPTVTPQNRRRTMGVKTAVGRWGPGPAPGRCPGQKKTRRPRRGAGCPARSRAEGLRLAARGDRAAPAEPAGSARSATPSAWPAARSTAGARPARGDKAADRHGERVPRQMYAAEGHDRAHRVPARAEPADGVEYAARPDAITGRSLAPRFWPQARAGHPVPKKV